MECLMQVQEFNFMKNIRCLGYKSYIEKYYLLSVAPILAGVKPSVLISFKLCCKGAWEEVRKQLEEASNLHSLNLYERHGIFSLLIYGKEPLEVRIRNPSSKRILRSHGYPSGEDLNKMLKYLKERFCKCKFPHEIGVFLGYPPEDVQTFIEKNGKDFLCCRYWKVYHNEHSARELFRCIDEAKAQAIYLLTQKIPIHTAVKMLVNTKIA